MVRNREMALYSVPASAPLANCCKKVVNLDERFSIAHQDSCLDSVSPRINWVFVSQLPLIPFKDCGP